MSWQYSTINYIKYNDKKIKKIVINNYLLNKKKKIITSKIKKKNNGSNKCKFDESN